MNRIIFIFELSMREMRRSVKINVLVLLSLAMGLLLPLMALANINVFILNIKNLFPAIRENAYYCNVNAEHLTEEVYEDIKEKLELVKIGGCEKVSDKITVNGVAVRDALCVVSEEYLDFTKYDLLEGESIAVRANAPENVCMVEESFFSTYEASAKVGDTVEVGGESYVVAGIFRSMDLINKVVVPLEDYESHWLTEKNNYIMFVQSHGPEGEDILQEKLQAILGQVMSVQSIDGYYKSKRNICVANSLSIFLATVPVTLFSLVNCILVLYGKVVKMKYETGIKIALGAKKSDMLLAYFFETSLLALGAYILDIILMPLIAKTTPAGFLLKFDLTVYLCGFLLVELLCFIISRSLVRKVAKFDIASVLKGE